MRSRNFSFFSTVVAVLGATIALALPAAAQQSQYGEQPTYSQPYSQPPAPPYGHQDKITGTVSGFDGQWIVYMHDDRGYTDHISLHQGTIINPTGIKLLEGMKITIYGYANGSTFDANRVDVAYSPYSPYYGSNGNPVPPNGGYGYGDAGGYGSGGYGYGDGGYGYGGYGGYGYGGYPYGYPAFALGINWGWGWGWPWWGYPGYGYGYGYGCCYGGYYGGYGGYRGRYPYYPGPRYPGGHGTIHGSVPGGGGTVHGPISGGGGHAPVSGSMGGRPPHR